MFVSKFFYVFHISKLNETILLHLMSHSSNSRDYLKFQERSNNADVKSATDSQHVRVESSSVKSQGAN